MSTAVLTGAEATSLEALARLEGADLLAPVSGGRELRYANFDYAASAPALASVLARAQSLLGTYASVHRGAGYASKISTAAYESTREVIAKFVGAAEDHVVVFTGNTTDSLALLAKAVPGDVVVLDIEHHATLLAWNSSRVVRAADTIEETADRLVAELCSRPAALLAVTGASNVTGEVLPIQRLADIAHACGARILIDAAQLAPHRPIDLAATGVDYLAFSGHKLYAPFGAGVLVGRRDWLDAAEPHRRGGGAVAKVTVDKTDWLPAPARHEAGTPNLLGVGSIAAACEAITEIGWETITEHERALTAQLVEGLSAIDGVQIIRLFRDAPDAVGIVAFTVKGIPAADVAAFLSDEYAIGVRDGKFCAHPLLDRLGLDSGAVRASLGLGTSSADVARLIAAVTDLAGRPAPQLGAASNCGGVC